MGDYLPCRMKTQPIWHFNIFQNTITVDSFWDKDVVKLHLTVLF